MVVPLRGDLLTETVTSAINNVKRLGSLINHRTRLKAECRLYSTSLETKTTHPTLGRINFRADFLQIDGGVSVNVHNENAGFCHNSWRSFHGLVALRLQSPRCRGTSARKIVQGGVIVHLACCTVVQCFVLDRKAAAVYIWATDSFLFLHTSALK